MPSDEQPTDEAGKGEADVLALIADALEQGERTGAALAAALEGKLGRGELGALLVELTTGSGELMSRTAAQLAEDAERRAALERAEAEYFAKMDEAKAVAERFDRKVEEHAAAVAEAREKQAALTRFYELTIAEFEAQNRALEQQLVEMRTARAYIPEELALIQAGPDPSRAATARALAALRAARDTTPIREALRNRHSTYQLTNDQRDRIKELALVLKLGAYEELATVGESEIVRTAVEHFLALNGATQLALLRDNRATEKKSKYGLYTPREPGED